MIRLDGTITVGNILTMLVMLAGLIGFVIRLERCMHRMHHENTERIALIESKVKDLWSWFIARRGQR